MVPSGRRVSKYWTRRLQVEAYVRESWHGSQVVPGNLLGIYKIRELTGEAV